jgi:hypothetical protein
VPVNLAYSFLAASSSAACSRARSRGTEMVASKLFIEDLQKDRTENGFEKGTRWD